MGKDREGTSGANKETTTKRENGKAGKCVPKSKTVPKLQIKSDRIREDINYMKERALIRKFVRFWPTDKTLVWWINTTWKPQGLYDMQLGEKGFFIVIFFNEEDKTRIFETGPYFFNSPGIFLRLWK